MRLDYSVVETQTFFECLASGVTSTEPVDEIVLDRDSSGASLRWTRPIRRLHPADEWTLKKLLAISVNGSFT